MVEIASEKTNTIVLPIPIDLISVFMKKAGATQEDLNKMGTKTEEPTKE